jgi:hypothetical protein
MKSGSVKNGQYAAVIVAQLDDPINRFKIVRLGESIRELSAAATTSQDNCPPDVAKVKEHSRPPAAPHMSAIGATRALQVATITHPKIVKPVPMSLADNLDAVHVFDLENDYEQ